MIDLISRNDAIEAIDFEKVYMTAYLGYVNEGNPLKQYNKGLDDAIKAINKLPSAEPERTAKVERQGICWEDIRHYKEGMCASCGRNVYDHAKYCDECGCRLEWE